ncbi:hypothetical protein K378_01453 [Streptomyces sp. Amel2xB2]|uniref:hypothetical protein n=1 Tax=Streptomyces sp. Amel2xB2 TaxID=1305829 RepID=UPI000DB9F251|nr:hypothetical protein [Streptomyces sp. Amel2xB2]RAJ70288.1 hypothetical protein K378_01453 [Streptomyces sp. Amel2xB2]
MPETPTSRLGLYRPKDDGSELVNVQTDLNGNFVKLDAAAGFQIVTSTTRPSTPYAGKAIAESDTGRTYFHNGTSPASAGYVELPNSSGTYGSHLKLSTGTEVAWGTDIALYRAGSGVLGVAGDIAVSTTTWTAYAPTVSNAGTATWAQRLGWYKKLGKIVFLELYLAASAAGSGTTGLTVSLPSTPYRDGGRAGTTQQAIPARAQAVAAGTNSSVSGASCGVILQSGSGAVLDQLRGPTDIVMRGEQVGAATIITVQGWYREA